jgi:hypothetical protein
MTLTDANEMVDQCLRDGRERDHAHLVDAADLFDDGPAAIQIVDALVEAFDITAVEAVERLARLDIAALREMVKP